MSLRFFKFNGRVYGRFWAKSAFAFFLAIWAKSILINFN